MKSKVEYKLALEVVGRVVHEWDPYGLLEMGCPDDEFDAEIASVISQIPRIQGPQDAAHALSRVFASASSLDGCTPDDFAEAGVKLFRALSDHGLLPGGDRA